jgi:hypothetical protein
MASRFTTALGLLVCVSLASAGMDGGAQSQAAAATPTIKVVYKIHSTPSNPQTPVAFVITATLERVSTSGSQATWNASVIQFRKKGTGGAADTVWEAYDVDAETTDGLWHVTHANVNTPLVSEFTLPPRYFGTAAPVSNSNQTLNFDFKGRSYTAPEGGAPYTLTAGMNYDAHTAIGPEIPPGTDEPVECPPDGDGSGTA